MWGTELKMSFGPLTGGVAGYLWLSPVKSWLGGLLTDKLP
jgi:hypothetical protein